MYRVQAPVGHPGVLNRVLLVRQHRRHAQTFYLTIISADCGRQKAYSHTSFDRYESISIYLPVPAAPLCCRSNARAPSPKLPVRQRNTWLDAVPLEQRQLCWPVVHVPTSLPPALWRNKCPAALQTPADQTCSNEQ